MYIPRRTSANNPDFQFLVSHLDKELAIIDGDEHGFYAQFNKIDMLKYVVLIFSEDKAVACGAIKEFDDKSMEVKRMYTLPEYRGKGIASMVLKELEAWALELNYQFCLLETGTRQPDAIRLYENNGYLRIPNYGQYIGVENSLCFKKQIN